MSALCSLSVRYSWVSVDSHPDRRSLLADRKWRLKALGGKSRVPGLQNLGMYVHVPPSEHAGPDIFVRLAKGYVVPGKPTTKKEVCALNAEVSARLMNLRSFSIYTGELIFCLVRLLFKLGTYTLLRRGCCWDHF